MNICFITDFCCVRVLKQACALINEGHKVHLISHKLFTPDIFHTARYYGSPYQLDNTLKDLTGMDIYVVHNEPTWPALMARKALGPNAPIIIDYHDSYYWYVDTENIKVAPNEKVRWMEEDYSTACADGFVTPSDPCKREVAKRTGKPAIQFAPKCSIGDYVYKPLNYIGGLVSQGGHSYPGMNERTEDHHRDYTELYSQLRGKCHVHAYSAAFKPGNMEDPLTKYYTDLCEIPPRSTDYADIIQVLGYHTWNLVGNIVPHIIWKYSMPNKLFDAIAGGVPSVVFNATEAAKIVKKYNIGIVVSSVEEFLDRWDEHKEKRVNLMLVRDKLCIEKELPRLVKFYEEIANAKRSC